MSPFFFKSMLSIILLFLTIIGMFTMFEVLGRDKKRYNIEKLKKIHRINGIIYFLLFLAISYLCIKFLYNTKVELSARSAFHSVFALTVLILFLLKIAIVKVYRQFYSKVPTLGLLIALITFGMVGTSMGYYLLVTDFWIKKDAGDTQITGKHGDGKITTGPDRDSIKKGKELFQSKCLFCHDPHSRKASYAPGLKDILKEKMLPVSKKPATPKNIVSQFRKPYRDMPQFSFLTENEVQDIIAFLNTL